jgi:hypothetical protein
MMDPRFSRGYLPLHGCLWCYPLKALDSKIGAIQVPTSGSVNRWQALLPGAANYDPFLRVGHCLFAILSGLAGAFVACRFHTRRERAGVS